MNNNENIVKYRDIGTVRYVFNRRAKNLSIRINQEGEVRVTIPRYITHKKAEEFLISRQKWILTRLSAIDQAKASSRLMKDGDLLRVREKLIPVELTNGRCSIDDAIWNILLKEGKEFLPVRVRQLARAHGIQYKEVKIRKMKSRWGSCSIKNIINLNSWLMMLPAYLTDYVILHELVHTIHKDHSPKFWKVLDTITGGRAKILRKELRGQRIMHFPNQGDTD